MFDLGTIQKCFLENKVFYTTHARKEMRVEAYGLIREEEIEEIITKGEIIEKYEDDEPYPSVLIYGMTKKGRPLHTVVAYDEKDDLAIIITVYHPDPKLWVECRRRK